MSFENDRYNTHAVNLTGDQTYIYYFRYNNNDTLINTHNNRISSVCPTQTQPNHPLTLPLSDSNITLVFKVLRDDLFQSRCAILREMITTGQKRKRECGCERYKFATTSFI